MQKTLVIGLGNPILSDDGVGVIAAAEIACLLASGDNQRISVTEACAGGLRLMEMMIGFDRVILIDAILGSNGSEPGTIHRMTLDDLKDISPTQHSSCAHDTSLVTALELAKEMGLETPSELSIYAIEVANIMDFNDQLTPKVAAAVPEVTAAVMAELGNESVSGPAEGPSGLNSGISISLQGVIETDNKVMNKT